MHVCRHGCGPTGFQTLQRERNQLQKRSRADAGVLCFVAMALLSSRLSRYQPLARPPVQRANTVRAQSLRTLLIDNFDSYTYNLFQLISNVNGVPPRVLQNNEVSVDNVRASPLRALRAPESRPHTCTLNICKNY